MTEQSHNTESEFKRVMEECHTLFSKKLHDYGASWRILRPTSLTDQLYIKAKRIRSLGIKQKSLVGEGIRPEFIALINYGIVGIIQLENGFEVAYVFNITKNNKYFLQRMRPYALAHGKMADAESIVAFITEDIAKFRQAQRSSNFHTFIETASLMNTLTAKLEELFLNNNVDGKLLTNFNHCIQNECDYVDALIDNSKPL